MSSPAPSRHEVPRVWLALQLGTFGAGKWEERVLKIDFVYVYFFAFFLRD